MKPLRDLISPLALIGRWGLHAAFLLMLTSSARADTGSAVPWHRLDATGQPQIVLYMFWSENCPHCHDALPFVEALAASRPWLSVESLNITGSIDNRLRFVLVARASGEEVRGVPAFFTCGKMLVGFDRPEGKGVRLAGMLDACRAQVRAELGLPVPPPGPAGGAPADLFSVGPFGTEDMSLPVLTLVLAGLDAFNPCAFFVLMFLLSLLVHARSRARMALVGGIFVLSSGLLYFAFMAAWLNAYLLLRGFDAITAVAGVVAVAIAVLNIKDYFRPREGPSLSVPSGALPRLAARLRGLLQADRWSTLLVGTVVLALAANSYELLCTSGFPLVYTRALTLRDLPGAAHYAYLAAYNVVYVLPLLAIVAGFVIALRNRRLEPSSGRRLKLLSGLMMLGLGLALLIAPHWLQRWWAAAALLALAGAVAALARYGEGRWRGAFGG